jgi:hypothetical protein
MRILVSMALVAAAAAAMACASAPRAADVASAVAARSEGTLARIYYWRARPGRLADYDRYIREVAEPIDREAQRQGAFLSVTTFVSPDSATPWTHMRLFVLRDAAQLAGLSAALDAAGVRLEPDSARRRARSEYGATLRDRVGDVTVTILR